MFQGSITPEIRKRAALFRQFRVCLASGGPQRGQFQVIGY
jgi:hypothetical protein